MNLRKNGLFNFFEYFLLVLCAASLVLYLLKTPRSEAKTCNDPGCCSFFLQQQSGNQPKTEIKFLIKGCVSNPANANQSCCWLENADSGEKACDTFFMTLPQEIDGIFISKEKKTEKNDPLRHVPKQLKNLKSL